METTTVTTPHDAEGAETLAKPITLRDYFDPESTANTCEVLLPNGIALGDGRVLRRVELARLGGEHEDMIRDKNINGEIGGNKVDRLLRGWKSKKKGWAPGVIAAIEEEEDGEKIAELYKFMKTADVTFLTVAARAWGIDPEYKFSTKCPASSTCQPTTQNQNLMDLVIGELAPEHQITQYEATVLGRKIRYRQLFSSDSLLMDRARKSHPEEVGTKLLLIQLLMLDGATATAEALRGPGTWKLRNAIRAEMEKTLAGIDTTLEMGCLHCKAVFSGPMPMDVSSFFFQVGETSSTKESSVVQARPYLESGMTSPFWPSDGDGAPSPSETSPSKSVSTTSKQ